MPVKMVAPKERGAANNTKRHWHSWIYVNSIDNDAIKSQILNKGKEGANVLFWELNHAEAVSGEQPLRCAECLRGSRGVREPHWPGVNCELGLVEP